MKTISYALYSSYNIHAYILIVALGHNKIKNIWIKIIIWKFMLRDTQNKKSKDARNYFF